MRRLRVGVIGAGLIAQVMHLHYLRELADRYAIAALADIVPANAHAVAARFGVERVFSDWRALLREPLDAVIVATGGSHAPMAIAAAEHGLHALVEKPMCYTVAEGLAMVDAADAHGTRLMVGYQKRYDPAYLRFRQEVAHVDDPRLMHILTLESPYREYVAHYGNAPIAAPESKVARGLRAESDALVTAALGDAAAPLERQVYENVLLGSVVHELNAMRGLLGEPDVVEHASLRPGSVTVLFRFGELPVTLDRIDLPGISRYRMDFAVYGPNRRATLSFPSPFLRSEPTLLRIEDGRAGDTASRATEEITSYESAFKLELIAFHEAVVNGAEPATPGADVVRDIALCRSIIRAAQTGRPVAQPSQPIADG